MTELDELKTILSYNSETGEFYWCRQVGNRIKTGSLAGHRRENGYIEIGILGKKLYAHRLSWLFSYGEWPKRLIDHIDGDRANNRISNLRDATHRINIENLRGPMKNNGQKRLGVYISGKKYCARITSGGQYFELGRFNTLDEAGDAYLAAKRKMHVGCTI